jgi:N-glycosylase/DNA lyase
LNYSPVAVDFDLGSTFSCGQTFRWRKNTSNGREEWLGISSGYVMRAFSGRVECLGSSEESNNGFRHFAKRYFSLSDDSSKILSSLPKDDQYLRDSISRFGEIRILTQDPWECLLSFVCSINKNIPAICGEIEQLSARFGKPIFLENQDSAKRAQFFSFPEPGILAKASKQELMACGLGFRWKFIKFISQKVLAGELDLGAINELSYSDACGQLISEISGLTYGVGPKVCDCALLFSLHKLEAFPIDVWILRCLRNSYVTKLGIRDLFVDCPNGGLSTKRYTALGDAMRNYFGKYAGYAQQYLYAKIRQDATQSRVQA